MLVVYYDGCFIADSPSVCFIPPIHSYLYPHNLTHSHDNKHASRLAADPLRLCITGAPRSHLDLRPPTTDLIASATTSTLHSLPTDTSMVSEP